MADTAAGEMQKTAGSFIFLLFLSS